MPPTPLVPEVMRPQIAMPCYGFLYCSAPPRPDIPVPVSLILETLVPALLSQILCLAARLATMKISMRTAILPVSGCVPINSIL